MITTVVGRMETGRQFFFANSYFISMVDFALDFLGITEFYCTQDILVKSIGITCFIQINVTLQTIFLLIYYFFSI